MQPIIKDNYLHKSYSDGIEKMCMSEYISWTFLKDITSNLKDISPIKKKGFSNIVFSEQIQSHLSFYLLPFFEQVTAELNFKNTELFRIRLGLNIPNNIECKIDTPHTDFNYEHFTMLYYVNDSDGPTNFYDQFYSLQNTEPQLDKLKITQQVEPKKGRFVIFDGLQYHSSSTPVNDIRIAINFNFKANLEPTNSKLNFY